jgi:hypothetical protein
MVRVSVSVAAEAASGSGVEDEAEALEVVPLSADVEVGEVDIVEAGESLVLEEVQDSLYGH